jgi:predicted transcriptional regulator
MLRDHKSMMPGEIWSALNISKQGALDLLRPLIVAGLVQRVGSIKNGRYILA